MEVLKDAKPANHIFYIRTKFRNQLVNFLKKTGIETLIHYPIIPPLQKVYKKLYFRQKDNFKNALKLSMETISLPLGNHLKYNDIKYVVKQISLFYKKNKYNFN